MNFDFELKDMFIAFNYVNEKGENGLEPEPVTIISKSKGMRLTVNSMNMSPFKFPVKIDVYSTIEEAIAGWGLPEKGEEIMGFIEESLAQE